MGGTPSRSDSSNRHQARSVIVEEAMAAGAHVVEGDATKDGVLREAHVDTASAVIAAVASASDNLVITLSVRALHPGFSIAARAVDHETEKKLILAGATAVVTPSSSEERMAARDRTAIGRFPRCGRIQFSH